MASGRRGFTLIELLIVITIIAILLLIIIPKIQNASQMAREDSLAENLRRMRQAVLIFQSDVGGFPTELNHLILAASEAADVIPPEDASGTPMNASGYKGPYFSPMHVPRDPFVDGGVFGYDSLTGYVFSRSDRIALDGTPYSDW